MVQKKAYDKLGIESDTKKSVKSEKKQVLNSQNQESRNNGGGAELKKMIKKSRSIKRSEFDCLTLRSTSMKRGKAKPRPEKPAAQPVAAVVTAQKPPAATAHKAPLVKVPVTQKVLHVKIPESPPNYMKSTTSSSARKEQSQVSPQNSKTSFSSKSPAAGRKDLNFSKQSSVSGYNKPGKTLTKTSSLRPVRTLNKSSSNKNGRNSAKRSSVTGIDQKIRRNTCSTTLKDSKFPVYVPLHPGGTEAEGTSIPKVCPYTYCSLNGHHHAELPPLKCFLKARRRSIKMQKSMRQRSLASNKRTPSGRPKEDIDTGQVVFSNDIAVPQDDSDGPAISRDEGLDFFLEIFAQSKEENYDGSYAGSPDDSSNSATSFEDNIDHDIDSILEDMDAEMFFLEYLEKEEEDDGSYAPHFTEAAGFGMFSTGHDTGESEADYSIFEASGMDWEEGDMVDTDLESEIDCFMGISQADIEMQKELSFKLDDIVRDFYEEVPVQEEIQIVLGDHDDFDGLDQAFEVALLSGISNEESNTSNDDLSDKVMEITEENAAVSEVLIHDTIVLETPDMGADGSIIVQEPESVESDTVERVLISNDLNSELPLPNVNINKAEVAGDYEDQLRGKDQKIQKSSLADEQSYKEEIILKPVEAVVTEGSKWEVEDTTSAKLTTTVNLPSPDQVLPEACSKFNKHIRSKRPVEEFEEPREFNPRGPNFLPLEPEEDPETVALRHQLMDERKNAEEWMLDFALQNVVHKLAPARKRKVALLVEAFEAVIPVPKYEIHIPHTPTGFARTRYLQACS